MTTKTYDKDGKLVSETPGTQRHPMGSGPRDVLGRPLAGPGAGDWEPGSPDSPKTEGSRMQRAAAAIPQIDRTNADNYTLKGKPKVEAIEQIAGVQITWHERDALVAWIGEQGSAESNATEATPRSTRKR